MKILYIFTSASQNPGSVQNKVTMQINALNMLNCICDGAFFSTDFLNESEKDNFQFINVKKVKGNYFRSSRQKTAYHLSVFSYVGKIAKDYDYIYYRYPGAHPLLRKLTKKYPKKIFFEHVTAETKEIKLYRKENPFELTISSFLSYFEFYWKPIFYEFYYGKQIREKALFGICNSQNIADYQTERYLKQYKTIVIGDAVDVATYRIKQTIPLLQEFKIAFLKGAGTTADFNGLDRIFEGIVEYNGPYKIIFYINGSHLDSEKKLVKSLNIENHVVFGNYINKQETDLLLDEVHASFGALAVHRKGLSATTTIKTREYFARGLPFVFAHNDPDFTENQEAMKYCLQLEANDNAVNFENIISWFKELENVTRYGEKMHNFALENLDYKIKMLKVINFLKQIKK